MTGKTDEPVQVHFGDRLQSFEPVVTDHSRVLILGSMPGTASLAAGEYYAHPRNASWPMLFEYFGEPVSADYACRLNLIRDHDLALWDVCHRCSREGSLDTAIRHPELNDIDGLVRTCGIGTVLCNGQKAGALLRRKMPAVPVLILPSTSPALTLPYSEKCRIWHSALDQALSGQIQNR